MTGQAEERKIHTHGVTHGYDPKAAPLLCSDPVSVPGEVPRLKVWMSPSTGQRNEFLMDFQL